MVGQDRSPGEERHSDGLDRDVVNSDAVECIVQEDTLGLASLGQAGKDHCRFLSALAETNFAERLRR